MELKLGKIIAVAAAVLAVVLAMGAWAAHESRPASAGGDPLAVVQNLIDAANASLPSGDGETFAALFTEDGFFESIDGGSFAIVGHDAMVFSFSEAPDADFHITLVSSAVDGDTVTGVIEAVDRDSVAAAVDRYLSPFTVVVDGDLVASLRLRYDESDAQTATYLAYLESQNTDDDYRCPQCPAAAIEGDQEGSVFVSEFDGTAFVGLEIEPGPDGVTQPAHIHTGTCHDPGPIVYPLASVKDGGSFTVLSASQDDLLTNDYIVNVHLSDAEMGTYVSCAALEAPEEEEPTEEPTIGLPNTGSGGEGADKPWLIVALVAAGAAGLAGLGGLRRARR